MNFANIEHAFETALHAAVNGTEALEKFIASAETHETQTEALVSVVAPTALPAVKASFKVAAIVLAAIHQAETAGESGIHLDLDAATVAELRAVSPELKELLAKVGITI